jgi:exopolyphosphatase / guanosine-5'-triphosphate,3'-diphosphate pyrophosphatase
MPSSANSEVSKKRIAAIDLGTNSFHAVIVDVFPDGTFAIVDALKEMVTLGRYGLGKQLPADAMERGIQALHKIKTLCDSYKVERILAYATSAIREASNGGAFIQRAIDEVRIKILAIPGTTEGELIAYAVQHAIALNGQRALIMDIGGGSTEFIICDNLKHYYIESMKLGVSRMTADHVNSDPISKSDIKKLEKFYLDSLGNLKKAVKSFQPEFLIGSSGTMQNIAAMIAAEKKLDTSVTINEFEYSADDFAWFYHKFIRLGRDGRLKVAGLDSKRVDFIVAGLVLVNVIIKTFGFKTIKTSTQAMREGIILRYIKTEIKDLQMLERYPNPRERSIHELLRKCRWHEQHSRQVTRLALKIFDDLRGFHKLTDIDRELLEYASLTHDIGYHISHQKHHKHALYLILNADLKGFSQEEIEVIAHVARYHRRSVPKAEHKLFEELNREQKNRVRALAGILRVADGLDRSHYQNVQTLGAEVTGNKVILHISTQGDPELEIWGAMRKRELFERLMKRALEIQAKLYKDSKSDSFF